MVLGLLAHVTLSTGQNKTTKKQKQKTVINLLFNVFLECKDDIPGMTYILKRKKASDWMEEERKKNVIFMQISDK